MDSRDPRPEGPVLRPPRQRESQLRTWPVVSPCRVWVTLFLAALPWGGPVTPRPPEQSASSWGMCGGGTRPSLGGSLALDVACLGSHLAPSTSTGTGLCSQPPKPRTIPRVSASLGRLSVQLSSGLQALVGGTAARGLPKKVGDSGDPRPRSEARASAHSSLAGTATCPAQQGDQKCPTA